METYQLGLLSKTRKGTPRWRGTREAFEVRKSLIRGAFGTEGRQEENGESTQSGDLLGTGENGADGDLNWARGDQTAKMWAPGEFRR